jgi:hypothetical protein
MGLQFMNTQPQTKKNWKKKGLKILKLLDDSMESKIYQDICPLSFLENQKKKTTYFMPFW